MPLTATQVKQSRSKDKAYKLSDGGGLYLLVNPNGSRYWRYKYRYGGKEKVLALGVYPEVSLKKARQKHQTARETLAQGSDLMICNEKDIAVVCLTNGGNAAEFSRTVVSHVFKSVKVNMFKPPTPAKKISAKPEVLVGRFRNVAVTVDITDENGTLMMAATPSGFAGIKAGSEIGFVNPRLAIANKMAIEMGGKPGQPCDWIRIGGRMLLRV